MQAKKEFNMDLVSKARNAIRHFNQTDPNVSKNPAAFCDVLKAIFVSEIFNGDELKLLGVTEEIIGKSFMGTSTDMHRDDRRVFLTLAKERINKILGIPCESTYATQHRRLQAA